MADHEYISGPKDESFMDKINHNSSSSDSDNDENKATTSSPLKSKIYVLGFDFAAADVFLWRNKKISAGVLGGVTAIWVVFELLEYHLLTFVCHSSILVLSLLFLWSNATVLINKRPPTIPDVRLPEDLFLQVASALRIGINHGFSVLREIAAGRDLKKFLVVVLGCGFFQFWGTAATS